MHTAFVAVGYAIGLGAPSRCDVYDRVSSQTIIGGSEGDMTVVQRPLAVSLLVCSLLTVSCGSGLSEGSRHACLAGDAVAAYVESMAKSFIPQLMVQVAPVGKNSIQELSERADDPEIKAAVTRLADAAGSYKGEDTYTDPSIERNYKARLAKARQDLRDRCDLAPEDYAEYARSRASSSPAPTK
ncbi:hypothetical protein [Nonomuraea glycinis]|nr:hypothetical protein [Nonomuraea glycinis]